MKCELRKNIGAKKYDGVFVKFFRCKRLNAIELFVAGFALIACIIHGIIVKAQFSKISPVCLH